MHVNSIKFSIIKCKQRENEEKPTKRRKKKVQCYKLLP